MRPGRSDLPSKHLGTSQRTDAGVRSPMAAATTTSPTQRRKAAVLSEWGEDGGFWAGETPQRSAEGASRRDVPDGLDWAAFSSRSFPDRGRHDLKALKAYEAYRNRSPVGTQTDR